MPDNRVVGLVLAAGSSSRYRGTGPKVLLPYLGRPLLQHAIDATGDLDGLVVVRGSWDVGDSEVVLPAGTAVVTPVEGDGQAASLRAGIDALPPSTAAVVVLLADQPGVGRADVEGVVTAWGTTRRPLVRTRYVDGPGHPVLLASEVFDDIGQIRGDQGARQLMAEHPELVHEVPSNRPAPPDIDTVTDYESLLADNR